MNPPRPIGFWRCYAQPELPEPQELVSSGWLVEPEKSLLASYLSEGAIYETWRGLSHCRFGCDGDLGCHDFTDGAWIWPEGLSHYIEHHDLMLPSEFIEHCREAGWRTPIDAVARVAKTCDHDFAHWIAWAASVTKQAQNTAAQTTASPSSGL